MITLPWLAKSSDKKKSNSESYQLEIVRTTDPIVIDGVLDEPSWSKARETSKFINKWPTDSGWADAQTKVKVIYDENGKPSHIEGTFVDITERLQMQEELGKSQKLESLGLIAGGIAHDFNNILAAILGNINLAMLHVNQNDKIYSILKNVVIYTVACSCNS